MAYQIRLSIPDMKCNGCVIAIKKVLTEKAGVTQFNINPTMKEIDLNYELSPFVLIAALSSAGFEATELSAENKDN